MPEPVTTYVFTFESSRTDDAERRAGINMFLKDSLRKYGLRLKNMRAVTSPQPLNPRIKIKPDGRPYVDIIDTVNRRLDGQKR